MGTITHPATPAACWPNRAGGTTIDWFAGYLGTCGIEPVPERRWINLRNANAATTNASTGSSVTSVSATAIAAAVTVMAPMTKTAMKILMPAN